MAINSNLNIDSKNESKTKSNGKKDEGAGAWDNVIQIQTMTDTVVEKANGDKDRRSDE